MDRRLFFEYLNSVTTSLEKNYGDKLVSIILFGSLVNNNEKIMISTDVDLLVVIRDSCSLTDFKNIKQSLLKLENKFFFQTHDPDPAFIKGLQRATGMFINFFICRVSDFKQRKFSSVFDINIIMGNLLAPQNSVWLSLLRQHRIIWGENVFREWRTLPIMTKYDLIKSFIMNWLLATGALLLYPFSTQLTKFSMEAMKWSLFTWKNVHYPKETLIQIIARYIAGASKIERQALQCLMEFRKNKKSNKYFSFLAWIFVLLIHKSLFRRS
ncbi:MAG: hypothetical protein ACFFAE_03930 [Candidatus Hodarchaeota archaeon]